MTTKHTPGPWRIEFGDSVYSQADYAALSQRGHTAHALCTIHAIPTSKGDTDANARLIAAAPDLLAALRKIHANAAESADWIRQITAEAIAKATAEHF